MSNMTAQDIIKRAMEDREVYDQMARREAEVWGKALPERQANEAAAKDQEAARELRLNRGGLSLERWVREAGRSFERCLSIGCGEGRLERALIERGVCQAAHGVDMAEGAVTEARRKATEAGLDITYEVADINFFEAEKSVFDLAVAQTCLHHVLHLEHVVEQVWHSLKPGGIFWVHDYIGESQFQYSDDRMEIANAIIKVLPEAHRFNHLTGRPVAPVVRKAPGTLVSPFESIRSEEIPAVLSGWFDVVEKCETRTILNLVMPVGTRAAYTETEEGRALFELILLVDRLCHEHGILTPVGGQYVLTPKPAREVRSGG